MSTSQYLSPSELHELNFNFLGENVLIHKLVNIVSPEKISIGDNVRIDGFTTITGTVTIGDYVHIGTLCLIAGGGHVQIGSFSTLSHGVKLFSTNDDYSGEFMTNPMVPEELTNVTIAPVEILTHVIIGANSVVLPGVVVGEGVAVGALSLVKNSLAAWTIYAGNPVKKIKSRSRKLLTKTSAFLE